MRHPCHSFTQTSRNEQVVTLTCDVCGGPRGRLNRDSRTRTFHDAFYNVVGNQTGLLPEPRQASAVWRGPDDHHDANVLGGTAKAWSFHATNRWLIWSLSNHQITWLHIPIFPLHPQTWIKTCFYYFIVFKNSLLCVPVEWCRNTANSDSYRQGRLIMLKRWWIISAVLSPCIETGLCWIMFIW